MLSQLILFRKSKNFTSDNEIGTSPIVSIDHYPGAADRRTDRSPIVSSHAGICRAHACFKHSNLLKVTSHDSRPGQLSPEASSVLTRPGLRFTSSKDGPEPGPEIRLRAFQPQQLKYTLLELELPRLLAPDLPSNCYSLRVLSCTHSNYITNKVTYCYFLSLFRKVVSIEQFARLLLSLEVVAVSHAPSPESNPNSPSPVKTMLVLYTNIQLIGQKFE
eukprot:TRINITY_DN9_c0_g1_i10.p2 TRINITY_DN9_c0_g1~~TRINITY_DN9_c0_g1_i10.p2  ORF type:complete len:218 (+),score=-16.09 TRINITY_DN9_c0_g1_i10:967-1620(+)